jgi:hypothetical protein
MVGEAVSQKRYSLKTSLRSLPIVAISDDKQAAVVD